MFCGAKFVYLHHRNIAPLMEHITIINRTTKKKGLVKLRFRIRDGRSKDIYYRSDIQADLSDLEKFSSEGRIKPKVSIYNVELERKIDKAITAIHEAYCSLKDDNRVITGQNLQTTVDTLLNGESMTEQTSKDANMLQLFEKFREDGFRDGVFGDNRYKHYRTLYYKLYRFLTINHLKGLKAPEFSVDNLMEFRSFLLDEYCYVERYPYLYQNTRKADIPHERRSINTVVTEQKMLKSFFSSLEDRDEILRSPFRQLGIERRKNLLRSKYNDPWYLYGNEFQLLLGKTPPKSLEETRDAFLVQCALGFRISDFKALSMDNVSVNPEGIPYIHYLPKKTRNTQGDYKEINTPIVRFAFDIILRTRFKLKVLNNPTGRTGYNPKIRALLQSAGIDRKVAIFNEEKAINEYVPIYSVAGSSLARRTHVDMLTKVQVNMYAAGLHREGSKAVLRYTSLELRDQFSLLNAAFGQESYSVDKDLNIQ